MQRIPAQQSECSAWTVALPTDAHIGQVSLTVRDLDRSVSFYRDVLGFRESKRVGRPRGLDPKAAAR